LSAIYFKYGRVEDNLRLLDKTVNYGFTPTSKQIQYIFNHYTRTRDIDNAYKLVAWLRSKNITMTTPIMNSLFDVCASVGQLQSAQSFLLEVDNNHFIPNGKVFETFLSMCSTEAEVDSVIKNMIACNFTWNHGLLLIITGFN
jgi:hypothetical protein